MGANEKKKRAYRRGVISEKLARFFLQVRGYQILAERYRTPYGEIDLVAKKGKCLVFVEVKARRSLDEGLYAVTKRQRDRIMSAAEMWIAENNPTFEECRFDVVLLTPKALPTHIKGAFMQE